MKPLRSQLAGLASVLVAGAVVAPAPDWDALGKRWWAHIRFLADDNMEGRDTGSIGHEKAAVYMADQFRAAGLQPAGTNGYRQSIDFHVTRVDEAHCSVELIRNGGTEPLKLGDDAMLGVSSQAVEQIEAPVVFVGYGLRVPELNYDDLAGLDLKGKIVV
ncbi:MAG: peptidase M28, partial [Thermoplasmata archaeon]